MSYSDFSLPDIKEKFQMTIEEDVDLFPDIAEYKASDLLSRILEESIPLALAIHTEKARSELIIAPILLELRRTSNHRISLFSGVDFTVDKDIGLSGTCDYIISLSKEQYYISSPIISVVEAKKEDIIAGLPQCAAEMIAARIFNERKEKDVRVIYGVVTTGSTWRFLKLHEHLYIDKREYYIQPIGKILGILRHMIAPALDSEAV